MTFVHQFDRRCRCTVTTTDEMPPKGQTQILNCEWTERPKPKHVREYVQWILSTNQILAERWQTTILYALGTDRNLTELWCFKPGTAPKLLEKLNVGIP